MHPEPAFEPGCSRRDLLKYAGVAFLAALPAGAMQSALAAGDRDPRRIRVDLLCDLVLPRTDTPGAATVGTGLFVLLALDHGLDGLSPHALDRVYAALDQVAGPGGFQQQSRARQRELLGALDGRAFHSRDQDDSAEAAWRALKPAIVSGYYTSEVGASHELVFEPVPGPARDNFKLDSSYRARSNEGFGGGI